jgi:hypothetical protein
VKLNAPIAGIFDMIFQGLWNLPCVDTTLMTELAFARKSCAARSSCKPRLPFF